MKKCKEGEHRYFVMTGRCFNCGHYKPENNLYQRHEKTKVLGVFKITRVSIYQGDWEVRYPEEKQSRWLPFKSKKDAEKWLERRKAKKPLNKRSGARLLNKARKVLKGVKGPK